MNLFTSSATSIFLALITSVIGFYITNVMEEMRSGQIAVYRLTGDGQTATLTLANVSRSKPLVNAKFGVVCTDFESSCLLAFEPVDAKKKQYFRVSVVAPLFIKDIGVDQKGKRGVILCATLFPNTEIQVSVRPIEASNLHFIYVASKPETSEVTVEDPTGCQSLRLSENENSDALDTNSIFLVEGGTALAYALENYFRIMYYVFMASVAALVLSTILSFSAFLRKSTRQDHGGSTDEAIDVNIRLDVPNSRHD